MNARRAPRIRRVLVALDASPGSVVAAAAAARMAAALEAELEGLFVEDHDLLRLSRSSQARQVGFLTGAGMACVGQLSEPTAKALPAALEKDRPGLLVLPIGGPGLAGPELVDLLADLRCPVLAVS